MSLRPRYSLLTLLVLTALVAGGVKLWYGPHRVKIPDRSIRQAELAEPEEISLWEQFGHFMQTDSSYVPDIPKDADSVLEFEYLRFWSEYRVTTVLATWKKPRYLLRVKQHDSQIRSSIVIGANSNEFVTTSLLINTDEEIISCEQLCCWVAGNSEGTKIEYKTRIIPLIGPVIHLESQFLNGNLQPIYYLTSNRKIYQLERNTRTDNNALTPEFSLNHIQLEDIESFEIQARLQEGLANLRE